MKVFVYRYGSLCEPDIIDSFKHLGFDVIEETKEIESKNITPQQSIALVSPKLVNSDISCVFTINFFPWLSEVCNIAHKIYISLIVDSPVLELYSNSLRNDCNRVFIFDKMLYNEFADINPEHIFHLPLSSNVRRYDQIISDASDIDSNKYSSEISFIGSTYEEKCLYNNITLTEELSGYTDGIIEAQLLVYGYNFIEELISDEYVDTFMRMNPDIYHFPEASRPAYKSMIAQQYISVKTSEQERLRSLKLLSDSFNVDIYTGSDMSAVPNIHNRGFAKSLTEMPLIFNNSKINLNITAKSIRSGLPQRIFDVLAAGGFLITNYQAELTDYFNIGEDLIAYTSMSELKDLCQYYLNHEDERLSIAINGYNKIKNLHNLDVRLVQILDKAFPQQ